MHCHLPGALYIFITVRMLEIFWSDKSEKSRFFSISISVYSFNHCVTSQLYVFDCVFSAFCYTVVFSVSSNKTTDKTYWQGCHALVQSSDFVVYRLFCVAVLPFTWNIRDVFGQETIKIAFFETITGHWEL